jgi:hypothetical protein
MQPSNAQEHDLIMAMHTCMQYLPKLLKLVKKKREVPQNKRNCRKRQTAAAGLEAYYCLQLPALGQNRLWPLEPNSRVHHASTFAGMAASPISNAQPYTAQDTHA